MKDSIKRTIGLQKKCVILLDSLNHRTFVNLLWDSPREWTSCQEKGFFFILCLRPAKVHAPSLCFKGHLGAIIMVVCCTTFTIDWNSFWSRIFRFHATSFCQVDNNLIFISPNPIPMFLLVFSLWYNLQKNQRILHSARVVEGRSISQWPNLPLVSTAVSL